MLGADPKSGDDGLLQVREIIRLRLNAELTTLSACDTGVGKLQGQEGISNLVEAFLVAGSKSVVASLWSADDTFRERTDGTFLLSDWPRVKTPVRLCGMPSSICWRNMETS